MFWNKKKVEEVKEKISEEPKYTFGDFGKYTRCNDCDWVSKKTYWSGEVCPLCGFESLSAVIGRWKYILPKNYYAVTWTYKPLPIEFYLRDKPNE